MQLVILRGCDRGRNRGVAHLKKAVVMGKQCYQNTTKRILDNNWGERGILANRSSETSGTRSTHGVEMT